MSVLFYTMDFLKNQHSLENQDVFAKDNVTCMLADDDIQCGNVAYNAVSHVLKFSCIYCETTYDNIEYFCQHLSRHIYTLPEQVEEDELACYKDDMEDDYEDQCPSLEECPEKWMQNTGSYCENKSMIEFSNADPENCTGDIGMEEALEETDNHSNVADIIEEIEESDDLKFENTSEDRETFDQSHNYELLEDNSCSLDLAEYGDNFDQKSCNNSFYTASQGNSFEECFLKETNIDKIRSEGVCVLKENTMDNKLQQNKRIKFQDMLRLRRKRKKVTTVKVIAVKNRIAELYERIRNQQSKYKNNVTNNELQVHEQPMTSCDAAFMEQETQDAMETYSANGQEECQSVSDKYEDTVQLDAKDISRKIIGETLITLIPEGTKIPNTLPSQDRCDKLDINMDTPVSFRTENYNTSLSRNTNNDKRAVCPACGKTFRSHFSLTIHKRIHYLESDSAVKLAHKCSDCDQLFNKLSQLKQHVEAIHYPEGFVCKICNRRLSSLSLLERHMVRVHLDRPFNCKECGKNFSDAVTFDKHIASHSSGEIYKCQVCGRKYPTEFFLLEHMRNHKEQIPQTCVVCGKVTLRITQHMKIHTPRPKRLLSCSVCAKVFNFSSGLSHHFKIMHKLPRPPPKPKKEPTQNTQKRKRKSRVSNKKNRKRNSMNKTHTEKSFNNSEDIIEEPSEVPDEVYEEEDAHTILNLATTFQNHERIKGGDCHESQKNNLANLLQRNHEGSCVDTEDVNHKEEEAKRVIVELIQSSAYTPLFTENLSSVLEVTPPIAREETISAVNSIVHDC